MYIEQLSIDLYYRKLAQWEIDQKNEELEGMEEPPEKPMCLAKEEEEELAEYEEQLGIAPDVMTGW